MSKKHDLVLFGACHMTKNAAHLYLRTRDYDGFVEAVRMMDEADRLPHDDMAIEEDLVEFRLAFNRVDFDTECGIEAARYVLNAGIDWPESAGDILSRLAMACVEE